ncbi:MAG TPA: LacI family DNA-binding transcriptional regulator [Aggregatilinea sp.]|uniref:LacI family DNA-binding transcriptional regulator n=1 Tax=Aggregatilinea sp. TaxID=2806333 RepID=UPI002BC30E4D|nr:LacI family DNA-binding transcriptional regulator [Aggregatilinea sp.]HML20557.1 LacI family DNA-binding transcriptional regulator [Aggregatilinea sp.]
MNQRRERITLHDVAREAGVSPMTVSRVINNTGRISAATRDRVRDVIARLDYRPSRAARTLVTNQTNMIAVITPDITNPYFAEIVKGVEDLAWKRDYSVLLANTNENQAREKAVLSQLEDSTVDGIIICSSRLPDDDLYPLIAQNQAVVVVNRQVPKNLASVVKGRDALGVRALRGARHLAETGHKRIGYLRLQRSQWAVEIEQFLEELKSFGLEANPDWCMLCMPTWEAGHAAAAELLATHPELDAVIGGNDLVALGILRAAVEAGRRVPDDLAIVGGDDIMLSSQVTPSLTTFHVPKYEIGNMAAELLFKRMEGDVQYREYIYTEELIRRGSAP